MSGPLKLSETNTYVVDLRCFTESWVRYPCYFSQNVWLFRYLLKLVFLFLVPWNSCFAKSKVSFCFTCPTPLLVKAMRQ